MKLLKFGGTSLASAKKFLCVANIIEQNIRSEQTAVVLSAPAKITNYLVSIIETITQENKTLDIINLTETVFINLIKDLSKIQSNFPFLKIKNIINKEFNRLKQIIHGVMLLQQCPDSIRAIIISRGEILSIYIMKSILKSKNYNVTVINPIKQLVSSGTYLDSTINIIESKKRIENMTIDKDDIILMPGFIAGNEKQELSVLGRNGSDYSAAVLAVCLNAKICEIWTDVDGVFTCDPREVSNAYLLKSISYKEAMELSYFGAKVLHPRTIEPIAKFKIPCVIKNTNNPNSSGTVICSSNFSKEKRLKGVTHLDHIMMLHVSVLLTKKMNNIISRILNIMSQNNIKIILITQSSSQNKINFCILKDKTNLALSSLNKELQLELKNCLLKPFKVTKNLSILSVVGSDIYKKNNIASKIFSSLGNSKINVLAIAQGSSKHSISVVIKTKNILNAVRNVHDILFYNKKIIHVFLIGIGGVGGTLLKQILRQHTFLNINNIEIKIRIIANSKKILISNDTIDLLHWEKDFQKTTEEFNIKKLNNIIQNHCCTNSVIIDCTSDELLSEQYINFLYSGFHIIASNKKANTSKWEYYQEIRNAVSKTNKKFLYETNVGAGLPVIETIQNLFKTGDKLIRFKGILSGSLSFIFGKLEEGVLLSKATQEARKLGFTEPNPCDDLSGIDVARKLLILAREAGHKIELKNIKIEPLLPITFKKHKDVNKFLVELKKLDAHFLQLINKALDSGNVLRYVGTIEETGECFIKLEEVNVNDPLYKIKNGENALAFYTNYYQSIPLVLRGYGAGNNVTASGVFSDLLRILS